jgi:hypothetical protein
LSRQREVIYNYDYSSLILKGIIIIILLTALFALNLDIPGIPINKAKLFKMGKELSQKTQEINKMNQQINEIQKKEPEFRNSVDQMSQNAGLYLTKKKDRVVEIPSILVYLEQVAKKRGLTIKKIDIIGLENKSATSETVENAPKNGLKGTTAGRNEILITGSGSYGSFVSYLEDIQIGTKELINIEDFKLSPSDKTLNYCDIELKISL